MAIQNERATEARSLPGSLPKVLLAFTEPCARCRIAPPSSVDGAGHGLCDPCRREERSAQRVRTPIEQREQLRRDVNSARVRL